MFTTSQGDQQRSRLEHSRSGEGMDREKVTIRDGEEYAGLGQCHAGSSQQVGQQVHPAGDKEILTGKDVDPATLVVAREERFVVRRREGSQPGQPCGVRVLDRRETAGPLEWRDCAAHRSTRR